jgi:hypothetical protein
MNAVPPVDACSSRRAATWPPASPGERRIPRTNPRASDRRRSVVGCDFLSRRITRASFQPSRRPLAGAGPAHAQRRGRARSRAHNPQIKCHTMPSNFRPNSFKTNDRPPHEVSHFFEGQFAGRRRQRRIQIPRRPPKADSLGMTAKGRGEKQDHRVRAPMRRYSVPWRKRPALGISSE